MTDEIKELAARAPGVTLETLQIEVNDILARLDKIEKKRGPASTREMTDDDARRILAGDLEEASHRACANELGLSYGQVYSCRSGYTFKHIYAEVNT